MKNSIHWRVLRPIILLVWAVFALILTTQTDQIPVVALMVSTIGSSEIGATIGHAGLFGTLTLLCYLALGTLMRQHTALLLASAAVLIIATVTELFQAAVSGRSSSLSDLLANWLGVFIVSFAVAYHGMSKSSKI
jgi:VanZ family protein